MLLKLHQCLINIIISCLYLIYHTEDANAQISQYEAVSLVSDHTNTFFSIQEGKNNLRLKISRSNTSQSCATVNLISDNGFAEIDDKLQLIICPRTYPDSSTNYPWKSNHKDFNDFWPYSSTSTDRNDDVTRDDFHDFWFEADLIAGTLELGNDLEDVRIVYRGREIGKYSFTQKFNLPCYIYYFGYSGPAKWIMETEYPYLMLDVTGPPFNYNDSAREFRDRTATRLRLTSLQYYFAVYFMGNQSKSTWWDFYAWSSDTNDQRVVVVSVCGNGHYLINQHDFNGTEEGRNIVSNDIARFWIKFNPSFTALSFGKYNDDTPTASSEKLGNQNHTEAKYFSMIARDEIDDRFNNTRDFPRVRVALSTVPNLESIDIKNFSPLRNRDFTPQNY